MAHARRSTAARLVTLLACTAVALGSTAAASGAAGASPIPTVARETAPAARVDTSARAEAAEIADEATTLSRDIARTLDGYARGYRGRLTKQEQRVLDGYVTQANRRMDDVVRETARLQRAARGGSLAAAELARSRSQTAWARAQMAAEDSFDSARAILEPHMSLGEKIEALADYTSLMGRFEDLGERIDTLDLG